MWKEGKPYSFFHDASFRISIYEVVVELEDYLMETLITMHMLIEKC